MASTRKIPSQPRFQAGDNSLGTISSGGTLIFDSYIYNPTGNYNTSNGRFTAPVAGFYQFNYCIRFDGVPSGISYIRVQPYVNGNHIEYYVGDAIFGSNMGSSNYLHSAMSFAINMAAGDYMFLQYSSGGGYSCPCYGGFSGYLVA